MIARIFGVAIGLVFLAAFIWVIALVIRHRRHQNRRHQAIEQRLDRLRRDEPPGPPPTPCCPYWVASAGQVHGPDCATLPGLETAYAELLAACCERWWTSLETDHDPTCRHQTRSQAA